MQIIWAWTEKIATLDELKSHVGSGWHDIVERLVADLEKLGWNGRVYQIKEKFGGLRFYSDGGSDELHDRVYQAEHESYATCEKCGKPGKLRNLSWLKTLCDDCVGDQEEEHTGVMSAEEVDDINKFIGRLVKSYHT